MGTRASLHLTVMVLALLVSLVGGHVVLATEKDGSGEFVLQTNDRAQRLKEKLRALIEAGSVHRRNVGRLHRLRGVVASGTGLDPDGKAVIRLFLEREGISGVPVLLDGIRVRTQISGRFYARRGQTCDATGDKVCLGTERWPLPVPIGASVGHPSITAGTIGARLTDGANVFILSNNHILAAVNQASFGDAIVQPGAVDGGLNPDDTIATLSDFEPITLCDPVYWWWFLIGHDCSSSANTIDAAIALTTQSELGNATPVGEYGSIIGYGVPSSNFHPAYDDSELSDLLGVSVRKYGRTTALTTGTVDTVDATVDVCYDQSCNRKARFYNQIIIAPGSFSAGGDSGSLIVDSSNRAVGLLFAGSETSTITNRIDLVMQRFVGLSIDDGVGVTPSTDIAVTDISVASNPVVGIETAVSVTVRNVGTDDVVLNFDVVLTDQTLGGTEIGSLNVDGLTAGDSTELTFQWTPTTSSVHTLQATHSFPDDDNATNDTATTDVTVLDQPVTGPLLQLWQGVASTNTWTTVDLTPANYGNDMVVVCTPNYDVSGLGPTVVRIRNAVGSSFDVGLARPWFGAVSGDDWSTNVHCMIVRAGVYNAAQHGVNMEAIKLANFATTDNSSSWVGVPQTYANTYSNPVVVGQVMSAAGAVPGEIGDWSVFWARGSSRSQPPSAGALYVGRHTGEDPNPRPPETLAYVIVEQGTGTMDGIAYEAGLGADTVRGMTNTPPYSYGLAGVSSPSTGILSQAGMDGVNGGWAVLYGAGTLTAGAVNMAIEEDWYLDSERNHTTEQVGYIVFD